MSEQSHEEKEDRREDEPEVRVKLSRRMKKLTLEMEDGSDRKVVLKEGPGTLRSEWMNYVANNTKFDRNGNNLGMKNFKGMESWLISRCLFEEDGTTAIKAGEIDKDFPSSAIRYLFDQSMELNGLKLEAAEKEGNS